MLAATLTLADGRELCFDDVGDRNGAPVLYVHGTPDSRRARHPDDDVNTSIGVRLIAVDRPGSGGSSPHPDGTVGTFADDVAGALDAIARGGEPAPAVLIMGSLYLAGEVLRDNDQKPD